MLQQVLAQSHWTGRLTSIDRRALTPLIWEHVKPLRPLRDRYGDEVAARLDAPYRTQAMRLGEGQMRDVA
jgi:hypothetical protein